MLITIWAGLLQVQAGDLSTDNLTVYEDTTIWGKLYNPGPSGALYSNGLAVSYSYTSNSSSQVDDSGNNNTGTVYSAIWTNGRSGSGYYYDGTNDYITTPDSASLDCTTGLTVMAWICAYTNAEGDGWDGIVSKGDLYDRNYQIGRSGYTHAHFVYQTDGTGRCSMTGNRNICDGVWHLIATTWTGSRFTLYVDGEEDVNEAASYGRDWSTPLEANSYPLLIGKISDSYSFSYFNGGIIDEVRVHNYALSSQEVMNVYLYYMTRDSADAGELVVGEIAVSNSVSQTSSSATNTFMGSVGIGTNTPDAKLHVAGDLKVEGNINLNGNWLSGDGDDEGVFVASDGKVGIGTASPQGIFDIQGPAANPRLVAETTGGYSLLEFYTGTTTYKGYVGYSYGAFYVGSVLDEPVYLTQNNTPRIIVAEGGNVGIGTNAPSEQLHVTGKGRFDQGVNYVYPLGDVGMGVYTNQ